MTDQQQEKTKQFFCIQFKYVIPKDVPEPDRASRHPAKQVSRATVSAPEVTEGGSVGVGGTIRFETGFEAKFPSSARVRCGCLFPLPSPTIHRAATATALENWESVLPNNVPRPSGSRLLLPFIESKYGYIKCFARVTIRKLICEMCFINRCFSLFINDKEKKTSTDEEHFTN
ncbi:hypothetical protein ABEB36_004632 [Hypothenemus hampei]|uniref:Uncharacterized protein n=1 Tax=Hypothenemus hampei TaxID=57062 RepID=A0ABD1F3Z6_HYPHA